MGYLKPLLGKYENERCLRRTGSKTAWTDSGSVWTSACSYLLLPGTLHGSAAQYTAVVDFKEGLAAGKGFKDF